jgi:mono/diheme cytochrome c family protein
MMQRRIWLTTALAVAGVSLTFLTATPQTAAAREHAANLPGRRIYMAQCAACHGETGKGDGRAACDFHVVPSDLTQLDSAEDSDAAIIKKIMHARRPMPRYESILTRDEQLQLAAYIRGLSPEARSGRGDVP